MQSGRCLCGAIKFQTKAEPRFESACHCTQCRKQSGHVWSSAQVDVGDLEIHGTVKWYEASETAKRGFCSICGSFLFWKAHHENAISFALGALDGPTGLKLKKHIFTADKGDYYEITDGLPQS